MDISKGKYWDQSWSPIRGCSHASPGCANCWAERLAGRFSSCGGFGPPDPQPGPFYGFATPAGWTGRVDLIESELLKPLHWKKPRVIALNWMGDLFHEKVPDEAIDRVFAVMALCPQHRFLVLTKRSKRMREYVNTLSEGRVDDVYEVATNMAHADIGNTGFLMDAADSLYDHWPLPNVGLGVSAEDQARADERIPDLLQTPAAMRWVSIEPMLEAVNVVAWLPHLDWAIAGGESGPDARFMEVSWARSIVAQCRAAGVPVFVKQLGAKPIDPTVKCGITCGCGLHYGFRDKKGADASEWPEDLRVRELPAFLEVKP